MPLNPRPRLVVESHVFNGESIEAVVISRCSLDNSAKVVVVAVGVRYLEALYATPVMDSERGDVHRVGAELALSHDFEAKPAQN